MNVPHLCVHWLNMNQWQSPVGKHRYWSALAFDSNGAVVVELMKVLSVTSVRANVLYCFCFITHFMNLHHLLHGLCKCNYDLEVVKGRKSTKDYNIWNKILKRFKTSVCFALGLNNQLCKNRIRNNDYVESNSNISSTYCALVFSGLPSIGQPLNWVNINQSLGSVTIKKNSM